MPRFWESGSTNLLATEQGFALWVPSATFLRGWALVQQGRQAEGMAQAAGMNAWRATGAEADRPYFLTLLGGAWTADNIDDRDGLACRDDSS